MSKRGTFETFEKEAITSCENESYLVSRNRKSIQLMNQLEKLPNKTVVKIFLEYL